MSVTEVHREIRCDLRQTHDTSAMTEGYTTKPNDVILRHLAECDENYISPEMDSAAVELYDVTFRRLRLPRKNIAAEHDKSYDSVSARRDKIDGLLNVDCAAVKLYDLTLRRLRLQRKDISPEHDKNYSEVSAKREEIVGSLNVEAVELNDLTFCQLRLHEFFAERAARRAE